MDDGPTTQYLVLMIFKYFLFGTLSGFLSSTPLGPINLWVVDHKLSKSPRTSLFLFLTAVIMVDMAFACFSLWGHFELLEESSEIKWAGILSGCFTAALGFILIRKALKPNIDRNPNIKLNNYSSIIQGFVLTAANPAFLLFWLYVANQIMLRIDNSLSFHELLVFLLGVMVGDILWFTLFSLILSKLSKNSQDSTLQRVRMAVGMIFLCLGLIGVFSYVLK